MKIGVIGDGGREYALSKKLSGEKDVEEIHAFTNNPGIRAIPKVIGNSIDWRDTDTLISYVREKTLDCIVLGSDEVVCSGLGDKLRAAGINVFGPGEKGAQLEGDKNFAHEFSLRHNIPVPESHAFSSHDEAIAYVQGKNIYPVMIKYPGLAAGKGAIPVTDFLEAEAAITKCFDGTFNKNGITGNVQIQEFLKGTEISAFFLVNTEGTGGNDRGIYFFGTAQDHKARFEDWHQGPNLNTGGMGTVSPSPLERDREIMGQIYDIAQKFLQGLLDEKIPYQGVVFIGLMLVPEGKVKVLEYNVRFGDPETQALNGRMISYLSTVLCDISKGRAPSEELKFSGKSLNLVLAHPNYPDGMMDSREITGLGEIPSEIQIIYAGIKEGVHGNFQTKGGRVLNLLGVGDDNTTFVGLNEQVLKAAGKIRFGGERPGWRTDIGLGKD